MGACGCGEANEAYKLKAPKGWYVIELIYGCEGCSHGPGILIHHPEAAAYFEDEIDHIPELPVCGKDEDCYTMIKCGLNQDEAEKAAIKCFTGTVVDGDSLDEIDAEMLGESFWKEALSNSPTVIQNIGDGI